MKDIRRRCNPMVDLSKFTSNKKILSKFVAKLCPFHRFLEKYMIEGIGRLFVMVLERKI